jgi:hypothetical protein
MCGRFTLFPEDYAELARLMGTETDAALAEHYRQGFKLGGPFQGGGVQGYEPDILVVAADITVVLIVTGQLLLEDCSVQDEPSNSG